MAAPELSVVVTIVDGGPALERCLSALAAQADAPSLEVIVPYDRANAGHAARYPRFRFLPMPEAGSDSHSAQHEQFDRRRAVGLAAASGDLVAILEDRGVPRPNWARAMVEAHRLRHAAAVGGAIENACDAIWNWAVYFCDFGRYQLPFEEGPRTYLSDVNICYRRQALEQTRPLWQHRYHETTVNWALLERGETLWLATTPVIDQNRGELHATSLLAERVAWGRLFAATRIRGAGFAKRAALALGTLILPVILFARAAVARLVKRRHLAQFILAAPAVFLLLSAWVFGELLGYLSDPRQSY